MDGGGIGHDDDAESGAVGGDMTGDGILERNGVGGVDAEPPECGEIDVGSGFADGDVVAAGDEIKE